MSLCNCNCHSIGKKFLVMGMPPHPCCGCKEDETMSICSHGVPIKLGCIVCQEENDIPVSPMVKQIQELSGQLLELKQWINSHEKEGLEYGDGFEKRDERIKKRLDWIEAWVRNDEKRVVDRFERVEARISAFEKEIPRIYNAEQIQLIKQSDNKPHKCPVCDGTTFVHRNADKYHLAIECVSCKGTGVIWG